MFPHSPQSSVPPDKLVQQMIVQALQAFYIEDFETGRYFLQQIRTNLPRFMYQLNPQLRNLCIEIVKLLQDGVSGVSVVGVEGTNIQYQQTKDHIQQRYVDLDQVAFHEAMGVCFGREAEELVTSTTEVTGEIKRHL